MGHAAAFDHYQFLVITNADKPNYLVNHTSSELDVASCVELALDLAEDAAGSQDHWELIIACSCFFDYFELR